MIITRLLMQLNNSAIMNGISVLLMNLGGKYLASDLQHGHDYVFNFPLMKTLFVFAGLFVTTRNITLSIVLTACYYIIVKILLNVKSNFCILPKEAFSESRK